MRRILVASLVLLVGVAAAIAFYVGAGQFRQPPIDERTAAAPPSASTPAAPNSFAFSFFDQPRAMPELYFVDGDGRAQTLADFRTKPVVLNIWATWCVPCRKEMPSLDRLQAKLGASQLLVLPLSIDQQGMPVVRNFYAALGLAALGIYLDQSGAAASKVNAVGVPTTLLIDRDGREIGRKIGPAEWDSAAVIALLRDRFRLSANSAAVRP